MNLVYFKRKERANTFLDEEKNMENMWMENKTQ